MSRFGLFLGLALFLILPTSVAAAECQFVLGFKTLRNLIGHEIVGECLESEHHGDNGDGLQQTTGGLLVWRKADNWTAFTDGYRTWINGPYGLVQRLNTERFEWEADYAPGGGIATPTPTQIPTPTPQPTPTPAASAVAVRIIKNLPWVRDGLTSPEMRSLPLLETLGTNSVQALRALVETERSWLPPQHESQLSTLEHIVGMSATDAVAVRQIVAMPFLEDVDGFDSEALWALSDLLRTNPGALPGIVSHPALQDSRTQTDGVIILIQTLKANDPEAAAVIEALSWVRDGIASREHRSPNRQDASRFEQSLIYKLVQLAGHSQPTFTALMSKPWMRDELTQSEFHMLDDFWELALWDKDLAQRMIAMPFLAAFDVYDQVIVGTIRELRSVDESLFGRVLAHPNLAGGITDDQTGEIFLVIMDLVAPQEAATIRALSWVQDGISDSDLGGLQVLQLVALSSPQSLHELIQKAWVQDGISRDEHRVIRSQYDVP